MQTCIIFRFDNLDSAIPVLQQAGVKILKGEDVDLRHVGVGSNVPQLQLEGAQVEQKVAIVDNGDQHF